MSRRSRFDENGDYLLPSERVEGVYIEDDVHGVFAADDLEMADEVARNMYAADSLTQKAAFRNLKHETLGKEAPFVRIVPPSVLKGTLGGQQQVGQGQNAQVALWGGEDAETTAVSVVFAPVQQANPTRLHGSADWARVNAYFGPS